VRGIVWAREEDVCGTEGANANSVTSLNMQAGDGRKVWARERYVGWTDGASPNSEIPRAPFLRPDNSISFYLQMKGNQYNLDEEIE